MTGEIFLACAKLDDFGEIATECLSASEWWQAGQFRLPRRQQEYVGGRFLLRSVLTKLTGSGRSSHEILTGANGKPFCAGGPAVSIAHSADTIVCAATADGEIGIDVELPPRPRDAARIAKRFFNAEEAEWIAEDPDERFLALWVIKEAWLKATGVGIPGGLDSIQCTVLPPDIAVRVRGSEAPRLGFYRRRQAFIGLATTMTPQESVLAFRWAPQANDLVDDPELQRVAATPNDPSE
ncbi:MAG: 4'-phosphopantetheinyl transferase superfamily protein [Woeseiaceae bacterium]|nr:4'-phosphopantetheinyl transferase superfamily protein [Woeseiaceae bacterium]